MEWRGTCAVCYDTTVCPWEARIGLGLIELGPREVFAFSRGENDSLQEAGLGRSSLWRGYRFEPT